jgi:hypothetical protein
MYDLGNCKNSVGLKPIAVRLRQTRSGARSQALPALPGNVFLAGQKCMHPINEGQNSSFSFLNLDFAEKDE